MFSAYLSSQVLAVCGVDPRLGGGPGGGSLGGKLHKLAGQAEGLWASAKLRYTEEDSVARVAQLR